MQYKSAFSHVQTGYQQYSGLADIGSNFLREGVRGIRSPQTYIFSPLHSAMGEPYRTASFPMVAVCTIFAGSFSTSHIQE
ncbi:hypothetical protein GDO78_018744 [Eleutherodactylus coqui]|uniref:Uncharacterized protein n=1 Tax=Eleutherodactylus coqui TaxID=57060 RepID=A0A8J6BDB2_ELECQ|nr:hypothetical protein GDO78_018744 [Eleutherodactylus coqui]